MLNCQNEEIKNYNNNVKIKENIENWSEKLVRFLTNPVVASLLTTFGFLGILFELHFVKMRELR